MTFTFSIKKKWYIKLYNNRKILLMIRRKPKMAKNPNFKIKTQTTKKRTKSLKLKCKINVKKT